MTDTTEITHTRAFFLEIPGHPTVIHAAETSDGNTHITIETRREHGEPLVTSMLLCPKTFSLLAEVLFRAAHSPNTWHPVGPKP